MQNVAQISTPAQGLRGGLGHPEGPDILPDGRIVMVENYTSRIIARSAERGIHDYAICGGVPNACMLGSDGAVYIPQNGGAVGAWKDEIMAPPAIQKAWPDGRVEVVAEEVDGVPFNAPNDLLFGPDGRLYFTDPGDYVPERRSTGRIFALNPDGTGELLEEIPASYPNGIVVEPDGSIVWVKTYERGVYRLRPGGTSTLMHVLPEKHVPDGLKVAANGDLWFNTVFGGGIDIIAADGTPLDRLERGPSAPWHGIPSEAVDVDHGQLVGRRLKDCPVVVDLHELSPVGRRATGRRDGRWFEAMSLAFGVARCRGRVVCRMSRASRGAISWRKRSA